MTSSKRNNSALRLSVIIPTYNARNTIERTISSIICGSCDYYPDEILVINDGSQDDSLEVVSKLSKKYEKIKVINLYHNVGASEARHYGVLASKNELLTFVDSDDYLETNALSKSYFKMMRNKADFCLFSVFRVYPDGSLSAKEDLTKINFPLKGQSAIKYTIGKWEIPALGIFRKTNYFKAYNNIHSNYFRKDELLSRETLRQSSRIILSDAKYYYVFNSTSITNTNKRNDIKSISHNNLLTEWALKHDALNANIEHAQLLVNKSIRLLIYYMFDVKKTNGLSRIALKDNSIIMIKSQFYIWKIIYRYGIFSFRFRTFAKLILVLFGIFFYLIYNTIKRSKANIL